MRLNFVSFHFISFHRLNTSLTRLSSFLDFDFFLFEVFNKRKRHVEMTNWIIDDLWFERSMPWFFPKPFPMFQRQQNGVWFETTVSLLGQTFGDYGIHLGQPYCSNGGTDCLINYLGIWIGLAVGIPVVAVIVIVIMVCVRHAHRRRAQYIYVP